MRTLILFLFIFAAILQAQQRNTVITDEKTGKPMLIGFIDRSALVDTAFSSWFDPEFKEYEVDIASLENVEDNLKDISFTIVLGTWCSDSHEQVPRFLKILDILNFNQEENITMIAVDRHREGQENEVDDLDIKFVPTFIVFRNSVEIGRIIETPQASLEKDLALILTSPGN